MPDQFSPFEKIKDIKFAFYKWTKEKQNDYSCRMDSYQ